MSDAVVSSPVPKDDQNDVNRKGVQKAVGFP